MTFSELTGHPSAAVRRGDLAVCVCATGDGEQLSRSLAAARAHGDAARSLFVVGDEGSAATVADLDGAITAAAPADVCVIAGGCVVTAGWLDGLRASADSDPRIGIVSPLGAAADSGLESRAAALAAAGPPRHADAPIPSVSCVLIRRAALELAGPLDRSLALPPALVDFAQRCLAHGLRHVLADDVLVGSTADHADARADETLARRYPYLRPWTEELAAAPDHPPAVARRREGPTSVTVDGRCLSVSVTGTAVATLDLVDGLRRHAELPVRVLVLDGLDAAIRHRLTGLGVELLLESEAQAADPTDISHRPYQLGAPEDLLLLRRLGRRMIVTQLDTIAYRTPAYFDTGEDWWDYRALTDAALVGADEVVFLSPHAAADADALGLVQEDRSTVIPLAVSPGAPPDECLGEDDDPPAPSLGDRPYLLCLGADFVHKNRRFALRLLEALVSAERFDGTLVLGGPHVSAGSSAQEEAAYLATRPQLAERVVDLGAVTEIQKRRLLSGAAAVVYPTTFEGFGLIPFEAAAVGVPSLFAWATSLRDLFPEELALLVPWDAEASARAVTPVLIPGEARDRQVQGVLAAGAALTHADYARRHTELYERALSRPVADGARIGVRTADLMIALARSRDDFAVVHRALDAIYQNPVAGGFVGPNAIVPEELQRAALALATRPALRDRAVGLYRAARRVR